MSGAITHNADQNSGRAFWLELPTAAIASPSLPDPVRAAASPSHRTLLLVDDIAMNRDILGAFLRDAGYAVRLEADGREAIRLASEQAFDLILMDVRMPEIDGLEATRHIRAVPGPHGQVPVLALTAYAFPEQGAQCRLAGMDGYVTKPVDYGTLIRTIENTIARVPPCWPDDLPVPSPAQDEGTPPLRLDRAVLDQALALLSPDEVVAHLQALRVRKEQMVRLLDQSADLALLTDAAHALGSAAGLFGFVALAKISRRFERALAHDAPEVEQLGQRLRAETCAALVMLDGPLYERRMDPAVGSDGIGHGVIVVENDPLARGIIRAVLRYAKQPVFLAADGIEAVILATQLRARLVLLDIGMPRLNGLLACEAIRAQPGYSGVPIIMLTGYSDERMHRAAQRLGATDFITKPFRPDALLARLEIYLDAPVRALRGVFIDVPAQEPSLEAIMANDDGDSLRGGWAKMQALRSDAPHAPLKGLRHTLGGVFLYAGVPPRLVQKWLGFAKLSPVAIGLDAAPSKRRTSSRASWDSWIDHRGASGVTDRLKTSQLSSSSGSSSVQQAAACSATAY